MSLYIQNQKNGVYQEVLSRPIIRTNKQAMNITDREKLIRITRGENLDGSTMYSIQYSLDIRGNLTIWGGMSFYRFEATPFIDDLKKRVSRNLRPIYEYHHLFPYTARIYQMEQDLDEKLSDAELIREFEKFRQAHPEDGFGFRLRLLKLGLRNQSYQEMTEEEKFISSVREDRDDKQEVLDRLLKQERQDILQLWGIDCPPDINNSLNYGKRLSQDKGSVSDWFEEEFKRIGGDREKLWNRR